MDSDSLVKDDKGRLGPAAPGGAIGARSQPGAQQLVRIALDKKLPEELKAAASAGLHQAPWKDIKAQAVILFPLPPIKGNVAIPSITELVKRKGDVPRGTGIFAKAGTCANCHLVNGEGKEVGPDLSEIGKKLSREALYESILYPSAGISHNYESYVVETKAGTSLVGLKISETPEEVQIKAADSIVHKIKKKDIDTITKSPISLMPADLHKELTLQDLADVVEYMVSLKDAKKPKK